MGGTLGPLGVDFHSTKMSMGGGCEQKKNHGEDGQSSAGKQPMQEQQSYHGGLHRGVGVCDVHLWLQG